MNKPTELERVQHQYDLLKEAQAKVEDAIEILEEYIRCSHDGGIAFEALDTLQRVSGLVHDYPADSCSLEQKCQNLARYTRGLNVR